MDLLTIHQGAGGSPCSGELRGWTAALSGAVSSLSRRGGRPEWQRRSSTADSGAGGDKASSPSAVCEREWRGPHDKLVLPEHIPASPTLTKFSWDRMSPRLVLARGGSHRGRLLCLYGLQSLCSLIPRSERCKKKQNNNNGLKRFDWRLKNLRLLQLSSGAVTTKTLQNGSVIMK